MDNELTLDNADIIKFKVVSPIFSIETLKHMRAGGQGTLKRVEGSERMLKMGQYVTNRKAIRRVLDDNQIIIVSLK